MCSDWAIETCLAHTALLVFVVRECPAQQDKIEMARQVPGMRVLSSIATAVRPIRVKLQRFDTNFNLDVSYDYHENGVSMKARRSFGYLSR